MLVQWWWYFSVSKPSPELHCWASDTKPKNWASWQILSKVIILHITLHSIITLIQTYVFYSAFLLHVLSTHMLHASLLHVHIKSTWRKPTKTIKTWSLSTFSVSIKDTMELSYNSCRKSEPEQIEMHRFENRMGENYMSRASILLCP